jgi:hypothetical protein
MLKATLMAVETPEIKIPATKSTAPLRIGAALFV